jgi:hypothetical protein
MDDMYPDELTTVCHISQVSLHAHNLQLFTVPRLSCPETQFPKYIALSYYDFGAVADFNNLTAPSMYSLWVWYCNIPVFPNLSKFNTHLRVVSILNSDLKVVQASALDGLELEKLTIDGTYLTTIPPEIFHTTQVLSLRSFRPTSAPSDSHFWNKALCATKTKNLTRVELKASLTSLELYPPLTKTLCQREELLTVIFKEVSSQEITGS